MIRTCVIADRSVGFQSAEVTGEITEDSANSVCQTFSDLDGVPPITKNDLEAAHRTRLSIFGRCGNITEELGGNQNDDAPLSSSSRCSQHSGEAAANNKACAAGSRRSMARLEVRHNSGLLLGLVIVFLSQVSVVTAMNGTVRITITAIFEEKDVEDLEVVFYRTIQEFNNGSDDLTWFGQAVTAGQDVKETLSALCNLMEGRRSSLHVLVVFGNMSTIQTVSLLSQTLGIPMMGYMMDKGDGHIQVHNPFYLSLQPANTHMARGLVSLLAVNYWYRVTILVESELRNDGFRNAFHKMTHEDSKWDIQNELFLSRALTDRQIEAQLSTLGPNVSRIFILHSSTSFAQRVFLLAPRVLNNERQYAWIVTGNAYTRDDKILKDFPLGTKAFLMNHDLHVNELFRDTLDFILTVFQENPRLHRTKPRMLQRGCWTLNGEVPIPFHNDVYKCLIKTVIHGLTGELKFDVDGYLNISTFRVRNLVHDGHEHVWQDVGCVQGREVHPFGIIWPGEVRRLKSGTEGRKRYRVVTNPVQPFVMTEAPHPDYGECLTDTPCLNLTSKRKSQEEVLKAITAYENGMENQSDLYRIQCCRGLTIDMLNRLASDLDFDFTLYIVQDETYGQKKQGQWNGMMKDLIDGTAHFAVAAFSITRVRQRAIDFTDPYFFSGFSVLYSDRTRETSMLAFLEPFDIIVWFAIIVSANFAAVTMALFEWNSPFGLNPWGRKRKQNYSLASGLTMVFSVLFGHTVKTKSPKAWPSKVMQNCWASAAIFIIASYTANLAAFIAGKHAGINYNDIKDNRLLFIKVGSLQGSAVEEFLRRMQSKLLAVSSRYPVPKTDVGIDWVIKGKYDALLGDYPILDYARAHLAPSCELKLVSKIFGDDQYGLGLPKGSPLKAVLSKKILEYHQTGYVDDLKDVHFADAHCIKKRISEEDSKLEVGHLAGLFVMLCVGFGVGVLTLFLEYIVFWWLVPFLRQAPTDSVWRSIHGMFLSQRLHRTVNSAELVSPHESLREIVAIVRTRDFTRLFMKSTIRVR
ncbi:glutamate receptor ionotropic, NMDA 3A-like isoform X2 [Babylonia areolata]|uniref:glutamate receptor ionotropic, NMDA 3A-like isoform X2 n=1 Tax=Babylonia areolata TaxID=304850 RepID=UPI003FCF5D10